MHEEQKPTSQKPSGGSPEQSTIAGSFFCLQKLSTLSIKKVITEVLLTLHLYPILFLTWWRFRHLIKIMTELKTY